MPDYAKKWLTNRKVNDIIYFAERSAESVQQNIGAWLSLVERPVRDREVAGSNPVAPTKRDFHFRRRSLFYIIGKSPESYDTKTFRTGCTGAVPTERGYADAEELSLESEVFCRIA